MPTGGAVSGPIDDQALGDLVARLAEHHTVVLTLGDVPGPVPLQRLLGGIDAALVTVIDGWTATEEARVTIDVLEAMVPRRVGFVLVEN